MSMHQTNANVSFPPLLLVLFAASACCSRLASAIGAGATTTVYNIDLPPSEATSTIRSKGGAEYGHPLLNQLDGESQLNTGNSLPALLGAIGWQWMRTRETNAADMPRSLVEAETGEAWNSEQIFLRRSLAEGDFDAFNALLKGTTIRLPNPEQIVRKILWAWLSLDLTNIRCKDISLSDVIFSFQKVSSKKMTVSIEIVGLDINCDLNWRYAWSAFHDGGSAQMFTDGNSIKTVIAFHSKDFASHPPHASSVELCESSVQIVDINIQGDFIAQVVNVAEQSIRGTVAGEINKVLCEELGTLGSAGVSDLIGLAADIIDGYIDAPPAASANPLLGEMAMVALCAVRRCPELLDLKDSSENGIVGWFLSALDKADQMLGSETEDPKSPTGTGKDLGANKILRDVLLDESRAHVLPISSWPSSIANDGVIFQGRDVLTETTIILNQIKVLGLDTITSFDSLNIIGSYTVGNSIKWKELTFAADLTLIMKPSSHSDAVIVSPDGKAVTERITISTGVENVEADVSFLLALEQDFVGNIPLSSILDTSLIASCLIGAIHQAEISGLSVAVGDIRTPSLTGFISKGIDSILGTASDAAFEMYEAAILDALPNVFQVTVRDMVNDVLLRVISDSPKNGCPVKNSELNVAGILDFRDMFLSPKESVAAGGSGRSPYGNVGPLLLDLLEDQALSPDDNGLPKINSMLIKPMTKAQSGVEGVLNYATDLFNYRVDDVNDSLLSSFAESMELWVSGFRLENLDTMQHPIILLDPSSSNPMELQNTVNFGYDQGVSRNAMSAASPVRASVGVLVDIGGETPLSMRNAVDVAVEMPTIGILAHLLAAVSEKKFMDFPLRSVATLHCWLATIIEPELDEDGFRLQGDAGVGMALSKFVMSLPQMKLHMTCSSCTSVGLEKLPEIIELLEEVGTVEELKDRIVVFAGELLEGEWAQTQVDRFLVDSPKKCPHDAAYEEGYSSKDYDRPVGIPDLSRDTLELIMLAGSVLSQVGVVVIAESYVGLTVETRDPLSGQLGMDAPPDANLLDFSDLGKSFGALGSLADAALARMRTHFGGMVEDTSGPNADTTGKDMYVNVMLRDMLLDEDRAMVLPMKGINFDAGGISIGLQSIRILGLDTFTDFNILDTIEKQTLLNRLSFQSLDLEIDLTINMDPQSPNSVKEHMKVSVGLSEPKAEVALLLALDLDLIGDIELGSILRMQKILPCLLSASRAVELTQLSVSVGDISEPSIEGFISDELDQTIRSTTKAVFDKYKSTIVDSIPVVFDVTIRDVLNKVINGYMSIESSVSCPALWSQEMAGNVINFHDLLLPESDAVASGGKGTSPYGDLFRFFMDIIDDHVLSIDSDGLSKINSMLIAPMTASHSNVEGSLLFHGDLFGGTSNVNVGGFKAKIEMRAFDAAIENLDSMGDPMNLLVPARGEASVLENTATFGVGEPLRGSVGFLIDVKGDSNDLKMRNEIVVSADLSAASFFVAALVKVAEQPFLTFPLRDVMNFDCWLATIPSPSLNEYGIRADGSEPSLAIQELALSIAQLRLDVKCISCTSPGFEELARLLSSPEGIEDATKVANKVTDYLSSLLGGQFIHTQIDRMLHNAAMRCPHHDAYDPNYKPSEYEAFEVLEGKSSPLNFLVALLIVGSLLFASLAIVAVLLRCIVRQRHRRWFASLPEEEKRNVQMKQVKALERESELCLRTKAMALSHTIPLGVRIIMPLIILGNVALFLSGHLSLGATVSIKAELAGEPLVVEQFFTFSMAYSVGEMWNAGAKELAVLILIFSGVWPYTKQLITFVLWFMPPNRVSNTRRGKIFLWLDRLAKWSMIDIFVLLATVAAFRISIESPDVAFLPDGFYSIDLAVIPVWGLYANAIAQLVSQVSSHFIIHYHRKVVAAAAPAPEKDDAVKEDEQKPTLQTVSLEADCVSSCPSDSASDTPDADLDPPGQALCNHSFQTGFDAKGRQVTVRRWVNKVVVLGAIATTALIISGCTFYSFSLEVFGVIGVAVESGQDFEQAKMYHNLFTLAGVLIEEARFLGVGRFYVGLGSLSALLILTVLVVPILQAGALVRQWFAQMTKRDRNRMHVGIEVLNAWQYVEVYILAIVITSWQIGGVSDFMVNNYCGSLEETFSSMVYYGILDPSDAQCFRVEARLEGGTYVLIAAAFVLGILNHFVCKAAEQQGYETEERARSIEESIGAELSHEDDCLEDDADKASAIRPVPVRFTDTYRFLLVSDGVSATRIGILPRLETRCQDPYVSPNLVLKHHSTQIISAEGSESEFGV